MSGSMAGMRDVPEVVNLIGSLQNPFMATLVGLLLTTVIQSSSVTVSIVLLLANQDLLALHVAFYIILGCNIGACTTALLASSPARRTQSGPP